jgi:hypothetical protein
VLSFSVVPAAAVSDIQVEVALVAYGRTAKEVEEPDLECLSHESHDLKGVPIGTPACSGQCSILGKSAEVHVVLVDGAVQAEQRVDELGGRCCHSVVAEADVGVGVAVFESYYH